MVLLLLFHLFLCQRLFQELSHSLLLDVNWSITSCSFLCSLNGHGICLGIQFVFVSVDTILMSLRPEFLFTFRLCCFKISCRVNTLAVIWNQAPIIVLDDRDAIRLSSFDWVLNYLNRPCALLVLIAACLWQSLLFKQSFVSGKFAKDQVLVRISFIFLNQ